MSSTETTVNTDPERFFATRSGDATLDYIDVTVFITQTAYDEFEVLVYPNADTPAAVGGSDPDRHLAEGVYVNTAEIRLPPGEQLVLDADVTVGPFSASFDESTDQQRRSFPGDFVWVYC